MLVPNNKQNTLLFQYANTARWSYNWVLAKQKENYKNGGKFISNFDLRKELTKLKKTEEFKWLYNISSNIPKQAIKDACNAYSNFFKKQSKFPKFKTKKKSRPKFYQDNVSIKFISSHVKLEGFAKNQKSNKQRLNWVRLAEHNRIPFGKNIKYVNPRISFDGLNWFISVGVKYPDNISIITPLKNKGIGVDLGVKDLAVCSDGKIYKNINKIKKMKKLENRKKRLQRQTSKKYLKNKNGLNYIKTNNIIKEEYKIKKIQHKINGIKNNYIHQTTSEIVMRKPSFIAIEDLSIREMTKNKHLAKAIYQQNLYEFGRQLKYKGLWNDIEIRVINKWYPSSKTCHECGNINKLLTLDNREWICAKCGSILDRDYNASLNLRDTNEYVVYNII